MMYRRGNSASGGRFKVGFRSGAAILVVALLAGCSSDDRTGSVAGTVTLDGEPVPAGTVLFLSADGRAAGDTLAPDGTYALTIQPGRYQMCVSPPDPPDPLLGEPPPPPLALKVPRKYHDVATSELEAEVTSGRNTVDIPLTTR